MKRRQNERADQYTEIYEDDLYVCIGSELSRTVSSHYRLKLVCQKQEAHNAITAWNYSGKPPKL
jgi:hypothetical protein